MVVISNQLTKRMLKQLHQKKWPTSTEQVEAIAPKSLKGDNLPKKSRLLTEPCGSNIPGYSCRRPASRAPKQFSSNIYFLSNQDKTLSFKTHKSIPQIYNLIIYRSLINSPNIYFIANWKYIPVCPFYRKNIHFNTISSAQTINNNNRSPKHWSLNDKYKSAKKHFATVLVAILISINIRSKKFCFLRIVAVSVGRPYKMYLCSRKRLLDNWCNLQDACEIGLQNFLQAPSKGKRSTQWHR